MKFYKTDPELAAALGADYTISPDIVIIRHPEPDESINTPSTLVDSMVSQRSSLRKATGALPYLHANTSPASGLSEVIGPKMQGLKPLNLMRNRKGRLPHIVVGEQVNPCPPDWHLAMGTGDVDCVYHFALPELIESLNELKMEDHVEFLQTMVAGKRLKDISDLPLDLAV